MAKFCPGVILAFRPNPSNMSQGDASGGELRRQLGLGSGIAAVAGECIAVGIFLTPAGMAKALGSPLLLMLVWIVMGAAAVAGAICYGELATRFPYPGGTYVYLREGYGEGTAFLYGWMAMLIMDPGVTAAMALGMTGYLSALVPLPASQMKLVAIAVVLALAAINMLSTRAGDSVMRYTTWLKIGVIAALPVLALVMRAGSWSNLAPFAARRPGSAPLGAAIALSLVSAYYSFGGWWDASKLAGEVRDRKTLSRAFLIGVSLVTVAYVVVSGVFLYVVPLQQVTSEQGFVAQAGQVLFGSRGAEVFSLMVVACVTGSIAVLIMSAPRVYYAMARDRVFFKRFGKLSRDGHASERHRGAGGVDQPADRGGQLPGGGVVLHVSGDLLHCHDHGRGAAAFGGGRCDATTDDSLRCVPGVERGHRGADAGEYAQANADRQRGGAAGHTRVVRGAQWFCQDARRVWGSIGPATI